MKKTLNLQNRVKNFSHRVLFSLMATTACYGADSGVGDLAKSEDATAISTGGATRAIDENFYRQVSEATMNVWRTENDYRYVSKLWKDKSLGHEDEGRDLLKSDREMCQMYIDEEEAFLEMKSRVSGSDSEQIDFLEKHRKRLAELKEKIPYLAEDAPLVFKAKWEEALESLQILKEVYLSHNPTPDAADLS
jgi:hypothetical protein